jgi:hypothetical protein
VIKTRKIDILKTHPPYPLSLAREGGVKMKGLKPLRASP